MPKTTPATGAERLKWHYRTRLNPIRLLEPAYLVRQLEAYWRGEIKGAALLWDVIERRDARIQIAAAKRKETIARRQWEVVQLEDSPAAQRQKEAAEFALDNVTATDAVKGDYRRGVHGMFHQMMDARSKGWAAHELIWQPRPEGLTFEAKFVPLYFFEHKEGRLRYLEQETAVDGADLEAGGWMVTVSESALMEPSSVLYQTKKLATDDWLAFSEKFGIPGVLGKTKARKGDDDWNEMSDAVRDFMNDWGAVISDTASIELVEVDKGGSGQIPMSGLVDQCERAIFTLWRGGDLGSMSGSGANKLALGSNVQREEKEILEMGDGAMLCDAVNHYVLPWVIRYALNTDDLLVKFNLVVPEERDDETQMAIDRFLREMNVPIAINDLLERYKRATPDDGEELVGEAEPEEDPEEGDDEDETEDDEDDAEDGEDALANEGSLSGDLLQRALAESAGVVADELLPARVQIEELIRLAEDPGADPEDILRTTREMAARLPELIGTNAGAGGLVDLLDKIIGSGPLNALRDSLRVVAERETQQGLRL